MSVCIFQNLPEHFKEAGLTLQASAACYCFGQFSNCARHQMRFSSITPAAAPKMSSQYYRLSPGPAFLHSVLSPQLYFFFTALRVYPHSVWIPGLQWDRRCCIRSHPFFPGFLIKYTYFMSYLHLYQRMISLGINHGSIIKLLQATTPVLTSFFML